MNFDLYYEVWGEDVYDVEVTVWMLTYNNGELIEQAINAILSQNVTFNTEIVVFDDASTDNTFDVITQLQKYNRNILYLRAVENTYNKPIRNELIYQIKRKYLNGKYTAICEGDDLWIDKFKLQMQFDYMEKHTECELIMHNALWIDCSDKGKHDFFACNPYYDTTSHVLCAEEVICMPNRNPPTASFFHRRALLDEPFFYFNAPVGDYTLQLNALNKGTVYYDNRIMSVYRYHLNGGYTDRLTSDKLFSIYHSLGISVFLYRYNAYTNRRYEDNVMMSMDAFLTSCIMLIEDLDVLNKALDEFERDGKADACEKEFLLNRIRTIWKHIYDYDLQEYIDCHTKTYLYGAGDYARKLFERAFDRIANVNAVVVTELSHNNAELYNKKIIQLNKLEREKNVGFIIAISPRNLPQILRTIKENGYNDWICPFLGSTNI